MLHILLKLRKFNEVLATATSQIRPFVERGRSHSSAWNGRDSPGGEGQRKGPGPPPPRGRWHPSAPRNQLRPPPARATPGSARCEDLHRALIMVKYSYSWRLISAPASSLTGWRSRGGGLWVQRGTDAEIKNAVTVVFQLQRKYNVTVVWGVQLSDKMIT